MPQTYDLVAIDRITVDNTLSPRSVKLKPSVVEKYLACVDELPPVVIYSIVGEPGMLLLASGRHRLEAHKLARRDHINAEVRTGTRREARIYAKLCDLFSGEPLNREERRGAVEDLVKEQPDLSNYVLAEMLGVSEKTVRRIRGESESTTAIAVVAERIGKDGRTTNTSKVGKAKEPQLVATPKITAPPPTAATVPGPDGPIPAAPFRLCDGCNLPLDDDEMTTCDECLFSGPSGPWEFRGKPAEPQKAAPPPPATPAAQNGRKAEPAAATLVEPRRPPQEERRSEGLPDPEDAAAVLAYAKTIPFWPQARNQASLLDDVGVYLRLEPHLRKFVYHAVRCLGDRPGLTGPMSNMVKNLRHIQEPAKWVACVKCRGGGLVYPKTGVIHQGEGEKQPCGECHGEGYYVRR